MGALAGGIGKSEELILKLLADHQGRISIAELFEAMKAEGLRDETLIRAAIWHLIAQTRIDRDADAILVHENGA
jgi:hypothetical protein